MAKKKFVDQGEECKLDMSPMIDMVFLLLIFFIVVSTQAEVQTDPKVKPTIASHSVPQKEAISRIVLNIYYDSAGGIVYTNEGSDPVLKEELSKYISDQIKYITEVLRQDKELMTLHLRCDRNVEWKDIQVVKKAAATEGVIRVNFSSFQED
jgi:biopolymer transport protein ExbD